MWPLKKLIKRAEIQQKRQREKTPKLYLNNNIQSGYKVARRGLLNPQWSDHFWKRGQPSVCRQALLTIGNIVSTEAINNFNIIIIVTTNIFPVVKIFSFTTEMSNISMPQIRSSTMMSFTLMTSPLTLVITIIILTTAIIILTRLRLLCYGYASAAFAFQNITTW